MWWYGIKRLFKDPDFWAGNVFLVVVLTILWLADKAIEWLMKLSAIIMG